MSEHRGLKWYASVKDFMQDVQDRGIPTDLLSPGGAAAELGITRQAVHDRLKRGTLRGWSCPGVIYVDMRDVRFAMREKKAIAKAREQREKSYGVATT